MILKENHIFLTCGLDVAAIAAPLNQLNITYFAYSRTYHNGGRLWLSSQSNLVDSYYRHDLYKIGNTESYPSSYQPQTVLWETLPNQKVFEDSRQMGIDNGIFIIEPHKDYCEFFSFATTGKNHNIINTYLTQIDTLKKFGSYFKDRAKKIIQKAEAHKLYLPFHNRPLPRINSFDSFLEKKYFAKSKLTPRQLECAHLFLAGKTIKEIGDNLQLSPRTIETYLNNLKSKLHCKNKPELIICLSKLLD